MPSSYRRFLGPVERFFRTTPKRYTVSAGVAMIIIIVLAFHYASRTQAVADTETPLSSVTLQSVATLSSDTAALPVTGTVTSQSQATILAQSSGQITAVYRKLGDVVSAGEIIAKFENSSQSAALTQAQGSYDAAQAQLLKTQNGGTENQKDVSQIQSDQAQNAVQNDATAAVTAAQTAYASLDDAVHAKTDALFTNPRSANPKFVLITPDSQLTISIQNERVGVEEKLADFKSLADSLTSSSDVDSSVAQALADAQAVADYLNDVAQDVNEAIPSASVSQAAIAADQASAGAARSEVLGVISSLNGAKTAYDNAISGAAVSQKQLADTTTGGRPEDIAASQASVKIALGGLDAAQANLEKTVIRSPISGTIVTLPIKNGDYLTQFAQAAIVSNASALKIVTYVTADDAKTLKVGGSASIEGGVSGVITSIAPALDPTTNKIEVDIGLPQNAAGLTDNQTVVVNLDRSGTGASTQATSTSITIPIVALKITPNGPAVFTLSASSTLQARSVSIGSILGDRVVIESGLTPDMTIVADARGHSDGEQVTVSQ